MSWIIRTWWLPETNFRLFNKTESRQPPHFHVIISTWKNDRVRLFHFTPSPCLCPDTATPDNVVDAGHIESVATVINFVPRKSNTSRETDSPRYVRRANSCCQCDAFGWSGTIIHVLRALHYNGDVYFLLGFFCGKNCWRPKTNPGRSLQISVQDALPLGKIF